MAINRIGRENPIIGDWLFAQIPVFDIAGTVSQELGLHRVRTTCGGAAQVASCSVNVHTKLGAAITVLGDVFPLGPVFRLFSLIFYLLAVAIAIQDFKISSLDTRAKVTAMVGQLESEIPDLRSKLANIAK